VQEEYVGGRASGDPNEAGRPGGQAEVEAVLARAATAGVDRVICIGTGMATSEQALVVARETVQRSDTPRAWATVGLHPHEASEGVEGVTTLLSAAVEEGDGAIVAVGECGLDYFYEHSPRDAQRATFAAQVALAHAHGLALVIHARDAWDDLFDVLDAEGVPERTVLHCFTGGTEEIDRCLRAGMYVSFSGIITFKNAADVRAAAAQCPLERLLVETDSPFLAPAPHRGRTNEPSYLPLVGEAIAAVKGCSVDEVRERTALSTAMVFSTGR
jgi:TatD DNase family protein